MRAWIRMGAAVLIALAGWSLAGPASAEYLVPEAGLRFPDSLGSLTLLKGEKYPEAALGHGIEYRGRGLAGSVYVYNGGNASIPDGVASGVVRAEFAKARGDISTLAKMRGYPEPALMADRTIRANDVEFLMAVYRLVRNDVPVVSLLGMTGARRHFIKVRVSVPPGQNEPISLAFLADVGRLLSVKSGAIEAPPANVPLWVGDTALVAPCLLAPAANERGFCLHAPMRAE